MTAAALTLARDDTAQLREERATGVEVARMVRYRRTGSSPGMPRWYVEDWRARMTARRYVAPAYSPLRYVTRLSNEAHRAWIFERLAPPAGVTVAQYVRAWDRVNGFKPAHGQHAAA